MEIVRGNAATATRINTRYSSFIINSGTQMIKMIAALIYHQVPFRVEVPKSFARPKKSSTIALTPLAIFPFPKYLATA